MSENRNHSKELIIKLNERIHKRHTYIFIGKVRKEKTKYK